jgi:hypothetical protein
MGMDKETKINNYNVELVIDKKSSRQKRGKK